MLEIDILRSYSPKSLGVLMVIFDGLGVQKTPDALQSKTMLSDPGMLVIVIGSDTQYETKYRY